MEVYEIEYIDNTNLQETCDILQPVVFDVKGVLPPLPSLEDALAELGDESANIHLFDEKSRYPVQFPFRTALELLSLDTRPPIPEQMLPNEDGSIPPPPPPKPAAAKYYSERNEGIFTQLKEYQEKVKELDVFLQPSFTAYTSYDVCIGNRHATTPFRYHLNSRKFLVVNRGRITVKMAPWKKNAKYLHEVRDYECGEYRANMDVWNPKEHHRRDHQKVNFLEFDVDAGNILYIPTYWGYSIQYQDSQTCCIEYTYRTCFNCLAFLGEIGRTWLQQQSTYYTTFATVTQVSKTETPVAAKPDDSKKYEEIAE